MRWLPKFGRESRQGVVYCLTREAKREIAASTFNADAIPGQGNGDMGEIQTLVRLGTVLGIL